MNKTQYRNFISSNITKWQPEEPCFVVNQNQLKETIAEIKKKLPGEIAYSYKTNPDPIIATEAKKKRLSFLLSSYEESTRLISEMKISPDKLIFQSPSLTAKQYKKLQSLGISRFIIDSNEQLELILSSLESMKKKPELLVRINTGVTINNPELDYSTDSFLGFPIKNALGVFKLLNEYRTQNKIKLGIHNHLLSQNTFISIWRQNLAAIAAFAAKLKREGITIDTVDFGGGYPIYYGHDIPTFSSIAAEIKLTTNKISSFYPDINFIFEPGRKVVGESVTLVSKVSHVKKFKQNNVAILDCSVYSTTLDTLILGLELRPFKVGDNSKKLKIYTIRGCTPDSLDVFVNKTKLPELQSGDYVAFLHAGAYSFASDFISLKTPKHVLI